MSNQAVTGVSIMHGNYLNTQTQNPGNLPTWKALANSRQSDEGMNFYA
jgi:hypothetical protein